MDGCPSEFEQVLDAHLAADLASGPRPSPAVDGRPDPGLWFAMSGSAGWNAPANGRGWGRYSADGFRRPGPRADAQPRASQSGPDRHPPAPRPHQHLGAAGRDALRRLRQWGADLPDDFTAAELKRAYRQLALQHHPDHHAQASAATRDALGAAFHQIHVSYRTLVASLAAS